jgi:hypothetical protein
MNALREQIADADVGHNFAVQHELDGLRGLTYGALRVVAAARLGINFQRSIDC